MSRFLLAIVLVGQLHTETYGLKDVEKDEVRLGTLDAIAPPPNPKKSKDREATITFEGGKTEQVTIYGGVVWTDPRKSPIERRLRGGTVPPVGTRVIVVGRGHAELLLADAPNLRRVSLLFDPKARAEWLAGPEAVLRADADDADLGELARAELGKRGVLSPTDVLMGDERLLFAHYEKLKPADRRAMLDACLPLAQAKPEARDRLFALAKYEPTPETIGGLAPVVALYPPTDERRMGDARVALLNAIHRGPADLSPFADFLIALETNRPRYRSTDDELPRLTAMLDAAAKQKVAQGFLANATTSTQLFDGIDLFLVSSAARLAAEAPSPELLAPIERWDLTKLKSGRSFAVAGLVRVATAVGARDLPRVRALVEPVLAGKDDVPFDVVAAYRAAVPPVLDPPAAFTLKAFGLGTRSKQPGVEVRFDTNDTDPIAFLVLNFGKGDEVKPFPLDGDWSAEWKTNGWTFTTSKVKGGGRSLNLSAVPP